MTISKTEHSRMERTIVIAGNPNVGKSTIFNALTGMKQHTGNWTGKTVSTAEGRFSTERAAYRLVDIPGTYSLMPHSAEEEAARSFLLFGRKQGAIVVCDAGSPQRGISLALQVMELCPKTMLCLNLMDEARRNGTEPDLQLLQQRLGVPVIGTAARDRKTLDTLCESLDEMFSENSKPVLRASVKYPAAVEAACTVVERAVKKRCGSEHNTRFIALRLLENDVPLCEELYRRCGVNPLSDGELLAAISHGKDILAADGITSDRLRDLLVGGYIRTAEELCRGAVPEKQPRQTRLDRILTGKLSYPIMILLLAAVLWITIVGANYPSQWLSEGLFFLGDRLSELFIALGMNEFFRGLLIDGAYKVLAWVVSVMLPPMAIFFPLFTLLEDWGYLPRIAYNLDKPFQKCSACGKQALTMTMGFGCNAAAVVGCRIIDSRRERLIAILTNSFVPCNGRFPALIAVITMFFLWNVGGFGGSVLSALLLTSVILLGIFMTFGVSRLLSKTILRGQPSSFTLELPPYRKPQIGKVIVRSVLDRTLYVLGRAAAVAAPVGAIIWLLSNVFVGEQPLLSYITEFLDPLGQLMGLDGVILAAFLLGLPANEIVLPIIIMTYMQQSSLTELALPQMRELFTANGWDITTAVCFMLFMLLHSPCSTTLLSAKKEAGLKWALLAAVIPTVIGILLCTMVNLVF